MTFFVSVSNYLGEVQTLKFQPASCYGGSNASMFFKAFPVLFGSALCICQIVAKLRHGQWYICSVLSLLCAKWYHIHMYTAWEWIQSLLTVIWGTFPELLLAHDYLTLSSAGGSSISFQLESWDVSYPALWCTAKADIPSQTMEIQARWKQWWMDLPTLLEIQYLSWM